MGAGGGALKGLQLEPQTTFTPKPRGFTATGWGTHLILILLNYLKLFVILHDVLTTFVYNEW